MDATYSASAYCSKTKDSLPPPKWREDANRSGLFDSHLSFGNYADLEPSREIACQLELSAPEGVAEKKSVNPSCSANRWRFQNTNKFLVFISVMKMLSFPFSWFFWGTFVISDLIPEKVNGYMADVFYMIQMVISSTLFILPFFLYSRKGPLIFKVQAFGLILCGVIVCWKMGSLWGKEPLHIAFWAGTFLFFMGGLGFDAILWLYSKAFKHDGSEFNRLDGMLRFKRRFRRLFVAPFDEFDPVLQLLPSGYGSHDYALWLHHRYTDNKVCLATRVHSLGLDKANALAFWDCLQRYMDVTQPLPDLPVLEPSRPFDPVTVEHDRRTGRDPHYWRKRTYQGWQAKERKELDRRLHEYPWQQQPCIVRARIDPELSIEAYYRRQEAKGIFATPRADDFDNVHRH